MVREAFIGVRETAAGSVGAQTYLSRGWRSRASKEAMRRTGARRDKGEGAVMALDGSV